MESALDFHTARALLEWQIEMGATEAILDAPINRYDVPETAKKPVAIASVPDARPVPSFDPVQVARDVAAGASDLDALKRACSTFEHCDLKRGARELVFADGNPAARVMVIGEAPDRDDDRAGRPFVGRAGQLLDKMFGAILMGRDMPLSSQSIYLTNVLPWRLPQSDDIRPEDIAMMVPFLTRHIEMVAPDVIVLLGDISCQAILGKRGISRLRGQWSTAFGKPVLPMLHPRTLIRKPELKRDAWADLLSLQAKLRDL